MSGIRIMELVHGTRKASKCAPEDRISCLPDNVITDILDRLPTNEAVRTDILSRTWRFKWTLLTQLVFDKWLLFNLRGFKGEKKSNYNGRSLSRLFYYLKGPITKFVLYIEPGDAFMHEDVSHWVLFLSRKGIKELSLTNGYGEEYPKLPTELYSCMHLKQLTLSNCCLRHTPSFHGFPNLLSLDLTYVKFESFTYSEFISQCPLLEILIIGHHEMTTKMKLVEIAKPVNLKMLSLRLDILESAAISSSRYTVMITSSSLFQLTGLPKLQELHLNFHGTKMLAEDGAQRNVPTAFLCLKTVKLSAVDFTSDIMLLFVIEMICGSRNLQTLEIQGTFETYPPSSEPCSLDLDCNKMGQLKLKSVVLTGFMGLENEICLIKFILACSPNLKRFSIKLNVCYDLDIPVRGINNPETGRLKIYWEFCQKLLKLHRASPVAEIDIK